LAPGDPQVLGALENLALAEEEAGRVESAERRLSEVLERQMRIAPNTHNVANILQHMAYFAQKRGDLEEARRMVGRSLEVWESLSDVGLLHHAAALVQLGELELLRGDVSSAEGPIQRAVEMNAREVPGTVHEAEGLHALAHLRR